MPNLSHHLTDLLHHEWEEEMALAKKERNRLFIGYRKSVTGSKTRLVLLPEIPIKFLDRFRGLMRADRLFEFAEV